MLGWPKKLNDLMKKISTAAEREVNDFKGFKYVCLKAKAGIWPRLSYVCWIR